MYNTTIYFKQEKVIIMLKIARNLGVFIFASCISINSFAQDKDIYPNNDYDANYYGDRDEGSLVFKAKFSGIKSHAKQKGLPKPTSADPRTVGVFVENGFGAEASTTIFFSSNIAAELSLSFNVLRTKYSNLSNIANNYGGNTNVGKRKDLYMIPLIATGQFHLAPFGAIRPYVGGGYHGVYLFSKSKSFNIKNGHGPVAQLGVDFYAKDDTIINIDVKQLWSNTRVHYKQQLVGKNGVSSKVKLNPLVISAGVGFKL